MIKKITKIILFISLIQVNLFSAVPGAATSACISAIKPPTSMIQILKNQILTIYNVLPIKIMGISIVPSMGGEDAPDFTKGIFCKCFDPFPRIGIPISYWEPHSTIDVSNIPNCSPTLGMPIPIDIVAGSSFQEINKQNKQNAESYQIIYIRNPIFEYLEIFTDVICGNPSNKMDIGYISSIDPLWQNDMWSSVINPDAFLFANPIAQFACIADATTAQFGYPLDPLYWCLGSWNQTFPLTKATSGVSSPEAAMSIAAKTLFKLHRQLMLWGSIGEAGLCGEYPMPIMRKSQYNMYSVYPIMTHPIRTPIGRTGFLWSWGQDVPVVNSHVWTTQIYKKKDCCAF